MKWFDIQAKDTVAEVSIYDEIGGWGVTAKSFIDQLKATGAKDINLSLNSPGGSVFDGLAIFNALTNLKKDGGTVNVQVMGVAASIASVIAMAGSKVTMPENTYMMIHNPMGGVFGDAQDMRDVADVLDKIQGTLVNTYAARTGKSVEEITALVNAETWMTAQEAVDMGFADVVTPSFEAKAKFDLDRLPENVRKVFEAKAAPAPEPDPEPTVAPLADAVAVICAANDLTDFAAHFALKFDSVEAVQAAVKTSREIKALCALVKRPDEAAKFIRDGADVATARAQLCSLLAEGQDIDNKGSASPVSAKPGVVVKTADIWTARARKE